MTSHQQIFDEMKHIVESSRAIQFRSITADEPFQPDNPIHYHDTYELRLIFNPEQNLLERIDIVFPQICHHRLPEMLESRSHSLIIYSSGIYFRYKMESFGYFSSKYAGNLTEACQNLPHHESPSALLQEEIRQLLYLLYLRATSLQNLRTEHDRIGQIMQYIQLNYHRENLSIQTISTHFGYSPNYIQRVFRNTTGCNPKEFLLKTRMENAKKLLCGKQYLVKEVASICGYANSHYFSNAFRKYYGYSPSQLLQKK